jgi:phage-related protein
VKKIYIYQSSGGYAPFLSFMATQNEKARNKLEYALKSMSIHKGRLSEPLVKHFSIERYRRLYELREKSRVLLRVVFSFDSGGNIILLHPFVKRHKRDTNYALEVSLTMLGDISQRPDALMEYPFNKGG